MLAEIFGAHTVVSILEMMRWLSLMLKLCATASMIVDGSIYMLDFA
jgi:hypothetical protein